MRICAVVLQDRKTARAVAAALRMAGIPAEETPVEPEALRDAVWITDETGEPPESAAAVLVLYGNSRWLRSGVCASLTERFGSAFAAVPRPVDFGELPERVQRLPSRLAEVGESPEALPPSGNRETAETVGTRESPRLRTDPERLTVSRGGKEVQLTEREFALLAYFTTHAGRIVTREELRKTVWNDEADPAANVTDVYVSYLRKKLAALFGGGPGAGSGILTSIRGKGYLFREDGTLL